MRHCTKCLMPETRPDLDFDFEGVCDACRSAEKKHEAIDWKQRKIEFEKLINKFSSKDESKYDCVIPVSGGKDSHLTLYYAKIVYGLNPLCICFEPTLPTDIGRRNLENISKLGVDVIHFKQNPIIYKKLILEGFKRVGDMEWANHMGIWSVPVHFAIKFNIPFIFWGESPQMEYGGSQTVSEINKVEFDENWLNDYGCLNGLRPQDMVNEENDISLSDLKMYIYPSPKEIKEWGGRGVFIGYYFKWNNDEHLKKVENIGFERRTGRIEVSYTDYEKLDCLSNNLHDYLKYLKYGFGRATDSASLAIRNKKISREEGLRLVERYDGTYPKECIETFCREFNIRKIDFDKLCEPFINSSIFVSDENGFKRDLDGSFVLKNKFIKSRQGKNL